MGQAGLKGIGFPMSNKCVTLSLPKGEPGPDILRRGPGRKNEIPF